jgi:hypothetical protein
MKTRLFFVAVIAITTIISNQKLNAQNWLLGGNSVSQDTSLGTKNLHSVKIITDKLERIHIDANGNIGIGITGPTEKLHVAGNILSTDSVAGNVGFFPVIALAKAQGANSVAGLKSVGADLYVHGFLPIGLSTGTPGNVILSAPVPGGIALKTGRVGIGTSAPQQSLGIDSGMSVDQADANNAALYPGLVFGSGSGEGIASNRHTGINKDGLDFYTDFGRRMSITNAGRVGIGTSTPQQRLSIDSGMTVDQADANNAALYPGLVFGSGSGEGIASNRHTGINKDGLDFYTDFGKRMSITNTGQVGIGTTAPNSTLQILHSNGVLTNGLTLSDKFSAGLDWNIYSATTGELFLSHNSNVVGIFDGTNGVYSSVSDLRLKKNIVGMSDVLKKVMQLKPSLYQFNTQSNSDNRKYIGMIAQDVLPLFPEIVYELNGKNDAAQDILTLDYSAFGVIAIKAVQELASQNDSLKQSNQALNDKLNALSNKIDQIENAMSQCCNSFSSNMRSMDQSASKIAGARLDQNVPNPFNNSSSISYYIPSGSHNAQLMITDASGKTLKTYSITQNGSGKQIISGSELTSGMYQYSLLVDGKLVDSKKMVLSK